MVPGIEALFPGMRCAANAEKLVSCLQTYYARSVGNIRKTFPIGIDEFEKIRRNNFYYVDKTMFIKELAQNWGESSYLHVPGALVRH